MQRRAWSAPPGAVPSPAAASPSAGEPVHLDQPPKPTPGRRVLSPLPVILVAFLLIGAWYSVATPILEVSDEDTQEAVIADISAGHGLPIMQPAAARHFLEPAQEAGQPPLAYLLAAAATSWIHAPVPAEVMVVNPLANIGSPDYRHRNRNLFAHTTMDPVPWQGLALAVHVQRLLSLLYGVLAVAGVYRLGRLAAPHAPGVATLAAALCAFDPMLLFMAASADNDMLAVALCTGVLVLLATTLVHGLSWQHSVITGLLVGLTELSKLNAGAVALPVVGVYLYLAASRHRRVPALCQLALAGGIAMLVSGWWFWRNWLLYHDALALSTFIAIAGPRSHAVSLAQVLAEAPSVWYSFWGVFGNFSILLPPVYYALYGLLALLAGVGLLVALTSWAGRRHRANGVLLLLVAWLGVEVVALLRYTLMILAATGRLLFPAVGSIAVLLALGVTTLGRRLAPRIPITAALAVGSAAAAALAVPLAILPAYPPPNFVPSNRLQPERPLDLHFGNLDLTGVSMQPGPFAPGQTMSVTLFWQATGPITTNYAEALLLRGPDGTVLEAVDTLPGNTEVATAQWLPGKGLVDRIPIHIPPSTPVPELGLLSVTVYPVGQPARTVTPTDAHGAPSPGTLLARVELRSVTVGAATTPPAALGIFGGDMALVAATAPATTAAGGSMAVHLRWQALGPPSVDAEELLQLVDPAGRTVAHIARRPHNGGLPTSDWIGGEQVTDEVPLPVSPDVPPGSYRLILELRDSHGGFVPLTNGQSELTITQVTLTQAAPAPRPPVLLGYHFGNLELVGVSVPPGPVAPGSTLPVALTWRATGPIPGGYAVSLQLRGPDGYAVAQHDGEPLAGTLLTSEWPDGWTVVDTVSLAIAGGSPAPSLAHLLVRVYPAGQPGRPITPRTADGQPIATARIGQVELRRIGPAIVPPPLPQAFHVAFGNQVELLGASVPRQGIAGTSIAVTLRWQALRVPSADYTVFLHAVDASGHLAFQADSRPHAGRLPTTDWVAGEVVDDTMILSIPTSAAPGRYGLTTGLYNLPTSQRLLLADGGSELPLGTLTVVGHS